MVKISQAVWDQVYARLSNASNGLNPLIITNAATYGLSPFISIDWTSNSNNFVRGQVDWDNLDQSGIIKYPAAALYIMESANANEEKFHKFSGPVRCIFEVALSWGSIKGQVPFDRYSNCVEDVVVDVINRLDNQNWQPPVVYNGQIQSKRGPITFGGNNFRQRIGFSMLFSVDSSD